MQYVIIGNGVAGFSAAQAIREHDDEGDILIITDEAHQFYSRPGLAYLLTDEIPERFLFPFNKKDIQDIKLKSQQATVLQILPVDHQILLKDQKTISFDRLLIATGATAVLPEVPGIDLQGVVKLDNLDDARNIYSLARKAHTAVVVGGGITALELVEGLVARGVHTHYFLRGDRYWSNVLDETESGIVEQHLKEDGVEIHYHTELESVLGEKGKVSAVRTKDGKVIKCQILGAAIGIRPRKDLAAQSGLKTDRGILVNEYLQTSDPQIFAAGDVAQVFNTMTNQYALDSLWGSAREQGRAAGLNMCGIPTAYQKNFSLNVTRLAGLTTTILGTVGSGRDADVVGIARGDSESWRQLGSATAVQESQDISRIRLLLGKQVILGAILMGDQSLSLALENLIMNQVDISTIRSQLIDPKAPIARLINNRWKEWKEQHAAK